MRRDGSSDALRRADLGDFLTDSGRRHDLAAVKEDGPRIRLRGLTRTALWGIFLFELVMAGFVIWFVVLAPLRN